jgi:hypothetical protein
MAFSLLGRIALPQTTIGHSIFNCVVISARRSTYAVTSLSSSISFSMAITAGQVASCKL